MGAGRKTTTLTLKERSQPLWTVNCSAPARNLRKSDLGAVIFGCKHNTIKECHFKQLFGLPAPHFAYVKNIDPGLPLFLFNYSDRKLHGIFEAVSTGQMNINPYGWTTDGSEGYTLYGAQVRVRIRMQCQPLTEDQFAPIIVDNYYEPRLFWFELDHSQTRKLFSLFSSSPVPASTSCSQNTARWNTLFNALPSTDTRQARDGIRNPLQVENYNHSDHSNTPWSSWEDHIPVGVEAAEKYEDGLVNPKPNCDRSYASVVCSMSASLPQKKWLSLFKTSTSSDATKENKNIWTRAPESAAFPHSDQSNMEWESSCDAPCMDEENHILGAVTDESVAGTQEQRLVSWKSNSECLHSSAMTEVAYSLPQSNCFETLPSSDKGGENVNLPHSDKSDAEWESTYVTSNVDEENQLSKHVHEATYALPQSNCFDPLPTSDKVEENVNLPHSDESDADWESTYITSNVGEENQLSKPSTDWSATEVDEEEHVHERPNCEGSFSSIVTKEINSEDSYGRDSASPCAMSGVNSQDGHFPEAATVPKVKSSDFQSVVAKLVQEIEGLKASHLKQIMKVSYLEQELVQSKAKITELKNQCGMLELGSLSTRQVETATFEALEGPNSTINDLILIVGGFDGSSWLSTLGSYSPSQDTIKSLRSMSFVRSYASAAKLNDELYIIGGVSGDVWYDTVESYNPTIDQWVSRPSLNQKKGSLAGASIHNKLFAVGGGNGVECYSTVEMFDLNIGRWITTQSMQHKRFAPAAAEIDGTLYVVGGYDGCEYLKSVERLDPREHSWTSLRSMRTRRGCHSLVVLNEKLYALGGYDGDKMVSSVEIFDPRIGSWMVGESMNNARGYSGAVVIGDKIYVIGGGEDGDSILDTIECYKEGCGWAVTNLKTVGKRCFFSAVVL